MTVTSHGFSAAAELISYVSLNIRNLCVLTVTVTVSKYLTYNQKTDG